MKTIVILNVLLISTLAQANQTIRCFNKGSPSQLPIFVAESTTGSTTITNAVQYGYDSADVRAEWDTMEGAVNPRSVKYKGWIYFFQDQKRKSGAAIIFEKNFSRAKTESFNGSIMVPNDEREGGTTFLHCLKTAIPAGN